MFLRILKRILRCVGVLSTYMSVYHMYAVLVWPEEGVRSPRSGVTDSCHRGAGS